MQQFLPRRYGLLALDLLLFTVSWILAYSLRFGLSIPDDDSLAAGNNYALQLKLLLPWVLLTHVVTYTAFRVYQPIWRYASFGEMKLLAGAAAAHTLFLVLLNAFLETRETLFELPQRLLEDGTVEVLRIPWIIVFVYAMLGFFSTAGLRFSQRALHERGRGNGGAELPATLIVGAGDVADTLLRDLRRGAPAPFRPVCAVAENPERVGLRLHGVPVVGTLDKIANALSEYDILQVLIALDDPEPAKVRQVVRACERAEVSFRIVPSLRDLTAGKVEVSDLRTIQVEDLLGREPVHLELPEERNFLRGQTVLITGAGGSIGSEIARQAARSGATRLLLLGKGENSLFEITAELGRRHRSVVAVPVVADIRDADRLARVFAEYRPPIVLHAAAHKHVPLMESAPDEAVKNNVFGTVILARMAMEHGAERFVFISSDKAVRPSSVMGASKRLAETALLSLAEGAACRFVIVRFGNVLASRGSVIPLFQAQIRDGGPVTVTHPDVTRYFMTIPEAVSLVLHAAADQRPSSLYLLEMGEPVKIADLARSLITLSGLRPGTDIQIEYTGLRPGEKLTESLIDEGEKPEPTEIAKLRRATPSPAPPWAELQRHLGRLESFVLDGRDDHILAQLAALVPGYHPQRIDGKAVDLGPAVQPAPPSPAVAPAPEEPRDPDTGPPEDPPTETTETPGEPAPDPQSKAPTPETPAASKPTEPENPPPKTPPARPAPPPQPDLFDPPDEDLDEPLAGDPPEPDLQVESSAPPSNGDPDQPGEEPAPLDNEVDNPAMTPSAADQTISGNALVVVRVTPDADAKTLGLLIQQLRGKVLRTEDQVVCMAEEEDRDKVPGDVEVLTLGPKPQGALLTEVLSSNPGAGILITMSSETLLHEGALDYIRDAFTKDVVLAYGNFVEDRDGVTNPVVPHDHEGCPHERFEFGPMIAYLVSAIRGVNGIRGDLKYAWEYDLHLKLMERGRFHAIRRALYTHFLPTKKDGKGSAVYSPGMGPLGGFSYVFYPDDMEKEVTSVFEDALKRRKAWIDHETAAVDHTGRTYDVMASIVIPILNRVKYIGNAIEKIQQGTYDDFEIVVVDNGSTDGTIEKVQEIAAEDPRIRLLHGTGGTIASALNEGIRAARGKYICQCDSDDQYAPDTLELMIAHLESHPKCGLAISYYRLMDEKANVIEDIPPVTHKGYSRNQIIRRDGAGATRFFPKAVLEEMGYYDEEHYGNFGEDYDMVLKVGEKYDVDRVHKVLYFYRRHEDNTDVTRDPVMKYKNKNRSRQEALRRRIELNKALGKA